MRKIGLFGGTFDPIHYGHLRLAEEAREFAGLEQVVFIPANRSPFRTEEPLSDAQHRLQMVQLAIQGNPAFCVSDMEIVRGGTSYTIETLQAFQHQHPRAELFLLMGMDSLAGFPQWYQVEAIVNLCTLLVGVRPPHEPDKVLSALPSNLRTQVQIVPMTPLGISASEIRQRVAEGRSIRYLTPDDVIEYIIRNRLYQEQQ